jgi:hypothetical protein
MGVEILVHKLPQVYGCGGGHGKPIVHLWASDFLDTSAVTRKYGSTLGTSFLTQLLGRSKSFLLLLSTTMMVLEGSMLANAGFLGHLSPGTIGVGFLKGL